MWFFVVVVVGSCFQPSIDSFCFGKNHDGDSIGVYNNDSSMW